MARLPIVTRESLAENQRAAFDDIVQGAGAVPQFGPGSVMIHAPVVSKLATALNQYLRNESVIPLKIQEMAMLITAREKDCQHIWNAHAASAREAGVQDHIVDGIRENWELEDLEADEEALVNYAREIFQNNHASRGAYQAALEQFGTQGLIELTVLLGNYALLALCINAFDSDLPPNRTESILPV